MCTCFAAPSFMPLFDAEMPSLTKTAKSWSRGLALFWGLCWRGVWGRGCRPPSQTPNTLCMRVAAQRDSRSNSTTDLLSPLQSDFTTLSLTQVVCFYWSAPYWCFNGFVSIVFPFMLWADLHLKGWIIYLSILPSILFYRITLAKTWSHLWFTCSDWLRAAYCGVWKKIVIFKYYFALEFLSTIAVEQEGAKFNSWSREV